MSNNTIANGVFWKFAERICAQGVSFIISIVLARLLLPEDYGIISMILVFINIAEVFISSGFSVALIQNKDADEIDFSTIFICSLMMSLVMYVILFFCAPIIGRFYKQPSLVPIFRVLGIRLLINSFNSIQSAYVSRNMQFKKFFFATSIGTLISAFLGLYLAYRGAGAWALVTQYLCNSTIGTIVLFLTIDWHPKMIFSLERAKRLLSFGFKVMIADLIGSIYNEMRSLVIGRYYNSASLAYYNKAEQFPKLFTDNILNTVSSVLFPALSNVSDSKERIREMTRTAIRSTCFLIFPLMTGLCVMADPIICVVLTEKWRASVPLLQIACLSYAILPINNTNVQAIKAMGEGGTYLRIEMIKKICGIILIIFAAQISVMAIAISAVAIAFVYLIINIVPNGRFLGYGIKEQLIDVTPFAVYSALMGIAVAFIGTFFSEYSVFSIFVQFLTGVVVYYFAAAITKNKELYYFLNLLKSYIKKHRENKRKL